MHFIGVLNKDGGTFRTMDLDAFSLEVVRIFSSHGHSIEVRVVEGGNLIDKLAEAARDPSSDALLAGGGDGTISAAAQICFETGMPLAVLPAGTMNLFARSLKIPLGLPEALEALASGATRPVDIATANGQAFVHQYSVGIHTRLVKIREQMTYHSRIGKMIASLRAIVQAVRRPPSFSAEIITARGLERRKVAGISISNNALAEGHVPHADELDRGVLGVYVLKPMAPLALARMCIGVIMGRWKDSPMVSEKEVRQVTLTFPRRKFSAQALIDGELVRLPSRVDLKIHPGALKVVAPVEAAELIAA